MRVFLVIFPLLTVFLWSSKLCQGVDWGYNDVDTWSELNGTECDGQYQSPIDLIDVCTQRNDTVVVDRSLSLKLRNYDIPVDGSIVTIENNGHTVLLHINGTDDASEDAPAITGSALGGHLFQLQQIHFHWNRNGSHSGSEHSINGKKTAFEVHFVHFNTKYRAFQDAGDHPDGSAVLSVLFDYQDEEECPSGHDKCITNVANDNPALNPIISKLAVVDDVQDSTLLNHLKIDLRALLPSDTDTFYWYQGSLTTPPCSENLTWIVFPEIQSISRNQLHAFQFSLKNEDGKILGTTNRDIQPRNGRRIFVSNDDFCKNKNDNQSLLENVLNVAIKSRELE